MRIQNFYRNLLCAAAMLGTSIGFCSISCAAAVNITGYPRATPNSPSEDTFVLNYNDTVTPKDYRTFDYGAAGAFQISGPNTSKGESISLMRFNLNSAKSTFDGLYGPGNWTIQSVQLQLVSTVPNLMSNPIFNALAPGDLNIDWMASDAWVEGAGNPNSSGLTGINWNSYQSTFASGTFENLTTFSYDGQGPKLYTIPLPLSAGFSNDLYSGTVADFRLSAITDTLSVIFNSRDFNTGLNPQNSRPILTITAVPEPSSYFAVGLVAVCLGLYTWRYKRHACRYKHLIVKN